MQIILIVVNLGTAYPLENSPVEHDLGSSVIIEEKNLGNQTKIFAETKFQLRLVMKITNSLAILEPNRSDEHANSPRKQG